MNQCVSVCDPNLSKPHLSSYSCIRGRLLEVNENILERPALLLEKVTIFFHQHYPLCILTPSLSYFSDHVNYNLYLRKAHQCPYLNWMSLKHFFLSVKPEQPSTEGYIAVILPKFEESKSITEQLLTREQFESIVSKRSAEQSQPSWQISLFSFYSSQNCSGKVSLSTASTRLGEDWCIILKSEIYTGSLQRDCYV